MSHLLDSGLACLDSRLDIADTYVFRGRQGTVFVMEVNSSTSDGDREPGFHSEGRYDFRIDTNADACEDLTFRVTFGLRSAVGRQPLEVRLLVDDEQFKSGAVGALLTWGSTEEALGGRNGSRVWSGHTAQLFDVDSTVLEAIRRAFQLGCKIELPDETRRAVRRHATAAPSAYAVVLELPDEIFHGRQVVDNRIGFWATTTLATDVGDWRPIDRMGLPTVGSMFHSPEDECATDYKTTHPSADRENYGALFAHLIAGVVKAHGTAEDPEAYGAEVARLILPDILPYRLGSSANFGFVALNGRGLTDNAPDVMMSIVTNFALACRIGERRTDAVPTPEFPYLSRWCAIHGSAARR